jgi:hypothetical protein
MSKIKKLLIWFICFDFCGLLLLVGFLSTTAAEPNLSADVKVVGGGDKNIDEAINKANLLIQKAHLFDNFFEESNWAAFGELVKDNHYQKDGSINLVIIAWHLPPSPPDLPKGTYVNHQEIIPYAFCFANQARWEEDENAEITIGAFTKPSIQMAFRNNEKRELAFYSEYNRLFGVNILFYENVVPQLFSFRYRDENRGDDFDNSTNINWDKDGKITSSERLDQIRKFSPPVAKLPKSANNQRRLPAINLTTIKDKKILEVLQRAEKICRSKNLKDLLECLNSKLPLFVKDEHPTIYVRLVNGELQHIAFLRDYIEQDKLSRCGYYLTFKNNNLKTFAEGDIPLNFEKYYDATKKNNELDKLSIDGRGTEVKFHSNGYPASYKSIVKNRLFGRQIEWNDKGEVLSDVDLDIPKTWADTPKKSEKDK